MIDRDSRLVEIKTGIRTLISYSDKISIAAEANQNFASTLTFLKRKFEQVREDFHGNMILATTKVFWTIGIRWFLLSTICWRSPEGGPVEEPEGAREFRGKIQFQDVFFSGRTADELFASCKAYTAQTRPSFDQLTIGGKIYKNGQDIGMRIPFVRLQSWIPLPSDALESKSPEAFKVSPLLWEQILREALRKILVSMIETPDFIPQMDKSLSMAPNTRMGKGTGRRLKFQQSLLTISKFEVLLWIQKERSRSSICFPRWSPWRYSSALSRFRKNGTRRKTNRWITLRQWWSTTKWFGLLEFKRSLYVHQHTRKSTTLKYFLIDRKMLKRRGRSALLF